MWEWGYFPVVGGIKSHVHLARYSASLSSHLVQSSLPSPQVNKAFKSTKIQLLFFPHIPGLSLINPILGKWKTELFPAFGALHPRSSRSFFPEGSQSQEPGLLLPLPGGKDMKDVTSHPRNGHIRRTGLGQERAEILSLAGRHQGRLDFGRGFLQSS